MLPCSVRYTALSTKHNMKKHICNQTTIAEKIKDSLVKCMPHTTRKTCTIMLHHKQFWTCFTIFQAKNSVRSPTVIFKSCTEVRCMYYTLSPSLKWRKGWEHKGSSMMQAALLSTSWNSDDPLQSHAWLKATVC